MGIPAELAKELRWWEADGEDCAIEIRKLGRFTLTVAHLNHVPQDCRPDNLKALCSVCHCRMDNQAMVRKKMLKREWLGQLSLIPSPLERSSS